LVASGLTSGQESSGYYSSPILRIRDYVESNPDEGFPFWLYVTPEDQAVKALAAETSGSGTPKWVPLFIG